MANAHYESLCSAVLGLYECVRLKLLRTGVADTAPASAAKHRTSFYKVVPKPGGHYSSSIFSCSTTIADLIKMAASNEAFYIRY